MQQQSMVTLGSESEADHLHLSSDFETPVVESGAPEMQQQSMVALGSENDADHLHLSGDFESPVVESGAPGMQEQIRWIDLGELIFKRRIGEGGYGIVDEYEWEGRRVAVKTLTWGGRVTLEHEAALLTKVHWHPNVVELIGCAFDEGRQKGMLVMELLSEDLRSLIDKRRSQRPGAAPFSLKVSVDMMRQMAGGLQHLRNLRVLHRDLRAQNILVNPRPSSHEVYYDVKLSDFGRSKCNEQDSRFCSIVAPPSWRAPEVFRDKDMVSNRYTWSSDVYSFAMVCYEILSGDLPFQGMSQPAELHEHICDGGRPELPANCPEDLLELIEECWATNPEERPVISEVHRRLLAIAAEFDHREVTV